MTVPISVVVVNHNGRDYLDSCLAAIFAAEPAEVLLVDSGSTDGAELDAAEKWPLRLLTLGDNKGPSAARNFGMREATHERVLLIDNDVELLPGCLERLMAALDSDDSLAIVQARSLLGDADGPVHYDGGDFHFVGLISLHNWYRPQSEVAGQGLEDSDVAVSLCCLAQRDRLLQVGGFDERMFILFEDLALSYALRLAGYRVAVCRDALCVHKAGTAGLSTRGESRSYAAHRSFLHSRNRWIFLLTHYRLRTLILLSPAFLLYGLVHLAFVLVSGHLASWFRGKVDLLRSWKYLRKRRKTIQAQRRRSDRELLGCPRLTFNPGLADRGVRGLVRSTLAIGLKLIYGCVAWLI